MATITYTVTVATGTTQYGTGNKYYINGELAPVLYLDEGNTYIFDQSDSSNATAGGHQLAFSTNPNNSPAAPYTTGVTTTGTPGSSGANTTIVVAPVRTTGAPLLFYYCTNHSGMGNKVNLIAPMRVEMSESLAKVSTFLRTFTDAASLDDTASASDDLATESGINKNNVVSVAESLNVSAFGKPLTDTATVSEQININGSNQFTDSSTISDSPSIGFAPATVANSVSVSESINVQLIAGSTSGALLNKSALNTYSINS